MKSLQSRCISEHFALQNLDQGLCERDERLDVCRGGGGEICVGV